MYPSLTERENWVATQIVDIAICIHKALGPGLLESVYEKCFCYELSKRNIPFETKSSLVTV
jgi:GxxExxY protein